jgi:hypothetical protein
MQREVASPSWHELVPVFRRMEMRGEVRGGRFVSGVAGEQYATEAAVIRMREVRDLPPNEPWVVISAADPLNLTGIITPDTRVPANPRNALVIQAGRYVAIKRAGKVEFLTETEAGTEQEMRHALQVGVRRPRTAHFNSKEVSERQPPLRFRGIG